MTFEMNKKNWGRAKKAPRPELAPVDEDSVNKNDVQGVLGENAWWNRCHWKVAM